MRRQRVGVAFLLDISSSLRQGITPRVKSSEYSLSIAAVGAWFSHKCLAFMQVDVLVNNKAFCEPFGAE